MGGRPDIGCRCGVATGMVALMSELLVGAVDQAAAQVGMTKVFVGVILVAIIGNASRALHAVLMAMKNKMDLAINIAVGSSIQIALFVAPALVFASYVIARNRWICCLPTSK